MTNKQKFSKLVSSEKTSTAKEVKDRIANRPMLLESQGIALKILIRLDELNWTQKVLAAHLNVSPQQVSKIVSGKENLTIDTLVHLQGILKIPLLASYLEKEQATKKTVTYGIDSVYKIANSKSPHYVNAVKIIELNPVTVNTSIIHSHQKAFL